MIPKETPSFIDYFANLADPRIEDRCDHKLIDIFFIAVCAVICGADGFTDMKEGFQVKGGKNVASKDIDALLGAMQKFQCAMGVFMSVVSPTAPMLETIALSNFISIGTKNYPRLQLLTLHEHFMNKRPKLPPVNMTWKNAEHASKKLMQYTLDF